MFKLTISTHTTKFRCERELCKGDMQE